ncbi:CRE-CEH-19 protein [Aphelenchoides besseyi]|nr:CRE-CEH-19 protein [Aphelenchoides besseyi]
MSFNIQTILDTKSEIDTTKSGLFQFNACFPLLNSEFVSKVHRNDSNLDSTTSFSSSSSTSLAAKALYAIANDIKSPSLTELQMLFGFDARKHEYKRNRKSAVDRKPRQAYSALQLEALENEFAVIRQILECTQKNVARREAESHGNSNQNLVSKQTN